MGLSARTNTVERLRRRLAQAGPQGRLTANKSPAFSTPWRDLSCGALSEIAGRGWRDGPAAQGYAWALASRRRADKGGPIIWIGLSADACDGGRLYAPGGDIGGPETGRLTVCTAKNMQALLWAAEEAVRAISDAAVIIDARKPHRLLNLTATRRLCLAAQQSGAAPILIRAADDAAPTCSFRRFRVSAAPSAAERYDSYAPGAPRWRVELERCRAGGRGAWVVEWDDETGELREAPPLSVPRLAAMADGPPPAANAVA